MIRRVLSVGLAVAVQAGAVCALFLHEHVDTDHDDHHSTTIHAHFSVHARSHHAPPAGIALEEADHDHALYFQTFVAVEAPPFQAPDLPRATFALTPVVERAPRTFVLVAHGHDPPFVPTLDSRPPPLSLS